MISEDGRQFILKEDQHGLQFVEHEEGLVTHVYKDQAGLPTIGVGHLLTKSELASGKILIDGAYVNWKNGLTEMQARQLLDQDMDSAEAAVNKLVSPALNQCQFDALCSLTFNIGTGGFAGSSILKAINSGNMDRVPGLMRQWRMAGGKVCDTLVERREREIKLWLGQL